MREFDVKTADVLFREPSEGDGFVVYENESYRWLSCRNVPLHSAVNLERPYEPILPHQAPMLTALLYQVQPRQVLCIGLGGGEIVRFFQRYHPQTRLHVIEKSNTVTHLFNRYFNMVETDTESSATIQNIRIGDICSYHGPEADGQYDLIFLDIYGDGSLPDCLYDTAFYARMKRWLSEDGVLSANFAVSDEQDALNVLQAMREGFAGANLYLEVEGLMNIVALGFNGPNYKMQLSELEARASQATHDYEMDFMSQVMNLKKNNVHEFA
ncbi:MAG: hypothetical protein HUJ29_03315 [Gammaproteobacteria bacterium]|nr:hypothetical protein [Gammaproteobacteria bacterium]